MCLSRTALAWAVQLRLCNLLALGEGGPFSSVLTGAISSAHKAPLCLAPVRALFAELCHLPSALGFPEGVKPSILLSILTYLGISSIFVICLLFVCTVRGSHLFL